MASSPYDAVLCDIDGVIRHWPAVDGLEQKCGLPVGSLASAAFAPDRLQPAITGLATDEQWRAEVTADLAARHGSRDRALAVVDAWSALLPAVDHDVVALLGKARETVPVALVSNATTRLESDLERQGLAEVADTLVNTARIGYAKPDQRVYRIAAERVGVPLERCLSVDDTQPNVLAAQGVGMAGVHYRRFGDLRLALAPLLDASRPANQP